MSTADSNYEMLRELMATQRLAEAAPALLEACIDAYEMCDNYADGAPDAGGVAHECLRLSAVLREAIEAAGGKV